MKIKNILTAIIMTAITSTSFSQFTFNESDAVVNDPKNRIIQGNDTSHIDWTMQYIEAKGWSIMDTSRFKIPGQAKSMARRGAIVDAQRNLLERIKGIRITGETTVENSITAKDYILTRLDGILQGAELVGEPKINGNEVEVIMRVPIYEKATGNKESIAEVFQNAIDVKPEVPESSSDSDESPGLAFNLNGQELDPSLFPQIIDKDGNLLLDLSKYYNGKTGKFPKYMKLTKEAFDMAGYEKGSKIIDVLDATDGKIKIDPENIPGYDKINWKKVGSTVAKLGSFLLMLI